ncbi:MAG: DUF5131 family protein [Capsulimonas sp.]|uniref:DUF5131 family protein n=1 Tax=Capsulimonas sp. TaxID=2494211 RepID=UPI0032632261
MGEITEIGWTARHQHDGTVLKGATFNPWHGCVEVSPACAHCYARELGARFGTAWGRNEPRKFFPDKHWNHLQRWDKAMRAKGYIKNIFVASMSDLFEDNDYADPETGQTLDSERGRFFQIVEQTPNLMYLLLTKRPENMTRMAPAHWADAWPPNVAAMTTAENQKYYDLRMLHLLAVPAAVRGVSMEPLLGPVDLGFGDWIRLPVGVRSDIPFNAAYAPAGVYRAQRNPYGALSVVVTNGKLLGVTPDEYEVVSNADWFITGGESGPNARVSHPHWFAGIRDQCEAAGASFFHKQNGEWKPISEMPESEYETYYKPWPAALLRQYSESYLREFASREYKVPVGVVDYHGKFYSIDGPLTGAFEVIDGHVGMQMYRTGKHEAGRLIGGREWNGMPAALGGDLPQTALTTA